MDSAQAIFKFCAASKLFVLQKSWQSVVEVIKLKKPSYKSYISNPRYAVGRALGWRLLAQLDFSTGQESVCLWEDNAFPLWPSSTHHGGPA